MQLETQEGLPGRSGEPIEDQGSEYFNWGSYLSKS